MSTFRIDGLLVVKKIKHSRNGPFCVAELITDVGEFKVKDPVLDQFAEGEYKGVFWISEIYLAPYVSFGRSVTELRARLHDLQLRDTTGKPLNDEPAESELDPIDETPVTRVSRAKAGASASKVDVRPPLKVSRKALKAPAPADGKPPVPDSNALDPDLALFGDEIAALVATHEAVKLDPTIDDRARFRNQTARLRELGYEFDAKRQTWMPSA